jgi:hypothetical protein
MYVSLLLSQIGLLIPAADVFYLLVRETVTRDSPDLSYVCGGADCSMTVNRQD